MSFRLTDLKKSVRKGKDGYQVTPSRLEGRQQLYRIEFLLEQFEQHLGQPRKNLDPAALLDFVGDSRLGRGLLATLTQWYRMRSRTFAEVLATREAGKRSRGGEGEPAGKGCGERLQHLADLGIACPPDLRAWLYSAVNRGGDGFLSPADDALFWKIQARALGIRREDLELMLLLDRTEEAILVRTGPRPTAADVAAAYNARALTTLIRSCREITLRCEAGRAAGETALASWAAPLGVEGRVEGSVVTLFGQPDALGCWTRHGRRLERVALELLGLPELQVREVRGMLGVGERDCTFCWKGDTLALLTAGSEWSLREAPLERIEAIAAGLRRERADVGEGATWGVRRPGQILGVANGACLPHLELRYNDLTLYLRLTDGGGAVEAWDRSFAGKTPVALIEGRTAETLVGVHLAGEAPRRCELQDLGALLREHCARLAPALRRQTSPSTQRLPRAA